MPISVDAHLGIRPRGGIHIPGSGAAVPPWLRPNLVGYWSGQKRENVYYPLTNLVENGNFANGTTGWAVGTSATIAVVETILSITATGSYAYGSTSYVTSLAAANGKKIYIRAKCKVTSANCTNIFVNMTGSTGGNVLNFSQTTPTQNTVYTVSGIITCNATMTGNIKIEFRHSYADAATANGKVMEAQNVMAYDLTTIFGTGNEPTAPELDAILAADGTSYWEGTRSVLCNPNGKYFWYDASGNGRHMKMSNLAYAVGSNLDANGFDVDGVDDYGSIADTPETRLTQGGTLCAWIKPITLGELSVGRIIDKSTAGGGVNGYTFAMNGNNSLQFAIASGTGLYTANNAITLGKAQLVAVTFNSAGRHIYVNAVDVTSTGGTETALPPDAAGPVCIGNRAGETDCTFDGLIDRPMIINRALTQAEVQKLFQSTRRFYGV